MQRLSPRLVEISTGDFITMTLRMVQGAITTAAVIPITARYSTARRHPSPASSHTTSSPGTTRNEMGRTRADAPSSAPKSANCQRPNRTFHGRHTMTTRAPIMMKLKSVSVRATAVWKIRLG
jgi:hypothetical protein